MGLITPYRKEEQGVTESYGQGVNSYVRKPLDSSQLVAAVRQVGLYWLLLGDPRFHPGEPG